MVSELDIQNDKIIYSEFKKFLQEYFLGTLYDNIDQEERMAEDADQILQTLKAKSISAKGIKQTTPKKDKSQNKLAATNTAQSSSTLSGSSNSCQQ